jgi:hypothetical protein
MANRDESIDFDPSLIDALDHRIQPLKRLLSPVSIGTEHVPREGPVLLAGNHTIYGLVDIPMLGLEIYEKTGRTVRGLGDHNHFAVPIWRDLLSRIGAVRGTREICVPPIARGRGLGPLPRLERQYFLFGEPISTEGAGRHEDRDACFALREQVRTAIESQILALREVREADPERYPMQRLLRRLSSRLG